jgi:hypothetical protein
MSHDPFEEPRASRADWRIGLGLALTAVWLLGAFAYVAVRMGWVGLLGQPVGDLGDFLDGAFAPLAFLWLVLGLFLQQSELAQNNRAIRLQYEVMRKTAEQAEIQTRAIAANELHARQDTFIELAKLVGAHLEVISGMLFMSVVGPAGSGDVDSGEMDALWSRTASGESALFSRRLLLLRVEQPTAEAAREIFWGTPIRTRHSETFIHSFERLLRAAAGCDPEGMIGDALRGNGQGRVYQMMKDLRGLPAVPSPPQPAAGGTGGGEGLRGA